MVREIYISYMDSIFGNLPSLHIWFTTSSRAQLKMMDVFKTFIRDWCPMLIAPCFERSSAVVDREETIRSVAKLKSITHPALIKRRNKILEKLKKFIEEI